MGNVEGRHRLEREDKGLVGRTSASLPTGVLSRLTQRTKDSCPIEPLALTVIAVAHNRLYASESRSNCRSGANREGEGATGDGLDRPRRARSSITVRSTVSDPQVSRSLTS